MWMKASPSVRGICGFSSAMTSFADWAADRFVETSTPKEQKPCSSGGVTWMKRDVEREDPLREELRDLGEADRREVRAPLVDGRADALADEERVDAEVPRELRVGVGRLPERQDVDRSRRPSATGPAR